MQARTAADGVIDRARNSRSITGGCVFGRWHAASDTSSRSRMRWLFFVTRAGR